MWKNGNYFYKVDVMGRNGYSFMVVFSDALDEGDVIDKALAKGLFDDETDADYAVVDDLVSEYDIENFKDCTHRVD